MEAARSSATVSSGDGAATGGADWAAADLSTAHNAVKDVKLSRAAPKAFDRFVIIGLSHLIKKSRSAGACRDDLRTFRLRGRPIAPMGRTPAQRALDG